MSTISLPSPASSLVSQPSISLPSTELISELKKYPPEVATAALKALIKKQYLNSLYLTAKDLLGYTDINWHTHGEMIRALENNGLRKLIVMPRGTFKSSVGSVAYPIWLLMRHPDLRIMLDSEKYENSKNFIREIKGKLKTPEFMNYFGDWEGKSDWTEGSITIAPRQIIKKESSVTASGIGANKTGQHYDVIIHDDMNSDKNSGTVEARKKVIAHYQLNTSILDPGGIMAVIGTRYSSDDLIGWIIENEIGKAA